MIRQKAISLTRVNELLDDLLQASESDDVRKVVLLLIDIAKTDVNEVVEGAVARIKSNKFDGSKWSTLAFSILENLGWPEKAGEILEALVDHNEENPAYLNNLGVFMHKRGQIGKAIEYYARAYAIDYKYRGHEKAFDLPAWKNLHALASRIDKNLSVKKEEIK